MRKPIGWVMFIFCLIGAVYALITPFGVGSIGVKDFIYIAIWLLLAWAGWALAHPKETK